ncbi:fungal-specific transcription factor domain-containing protein [Aspergillus aurantiobrunneus]
MGNQMRNSDKRRVVNACSRCRQQKIKCSGDCPCSNCLQRKTKCRFDGEESKVHITKKHFSELKRRALELEEENRALQQKLSERVQTDAAPCSEQTSPVHVSVPERAFSYPSGEEDDTKMVNPLSCGPPKYISDSAGRPHYLGHTSNWSLTIRLLHLTHQALYKCPFPSAAHHVDTMTYSLRWNGLRSPVIPDIRRLPSLDHALFLTNATKFHTGQIFHLFDEEKFMANLHHFYGNPGGYIHAQDLWITHFLVIMALGKAFIGAENNGTTPPGAEYFTTAFMMLPDYSFLWKDPCTSAEVLSSMALYLQSIDWRTSAHNLIGQALRMLQVHGYHTNVSGVTNEKDLLRYQNVWWTVYVLERQISVLLGVPLGINDADVTASLPHYPEAQLKTATVAIHVKLSRAFSQVVNALYRVNELNSTFVKAAQEVLHQVANVASELRQCFPVPEQESLSGISRVSGYMNLLYHQCIMLATRPFLFSLVETCVSAQNTSMAVPTPIQLLLQICLESVKKTTFILSALHDQGLLDCFLPFDLESAVSAGLVITMATLVCPSLIEDPSSHLDTLSGLLGHMVGRGNLIAADQKRELNELQGLCARLKTSSAIGHYTDFSGPQDRALGKQTHIPGVLDTGDELYNIRPGTQASDDLHSGEAWSAEAEPSDWAYDMTPTQLLEVVDLLNSDNLLDWVDFASSSVDASIHHDRH